ncbi:hypothetical protein GJAV_G00143840 [Gymnothorax javanicus]|nr:hypothetical protein GJAV_G00143840 [Gymnothorax javanicus]
MVEVIVQIPAPGQLSSRRDFNHKLKQISLLKVAIWCQKMSIGSGIPALFGQGDRQVPDVQDSQVPQAAILYLLQEATKLVLPEARQEIPDSMDMDGIWSGERKEQGHWCSSPSGFTCSGRFSEHSEQYSGPQHGLKYTPPIMKAQPGSSPWEVMSLINQQCERLLYPENEGLGEADKMATTPTLEDTPSAVGDSTSRDVRRSSSSKEADVHPPTPLKNAAGLARDLGTASGKNHEGFTAKSGKELGENESKWHNTFMVDGNLVQTQTDEYDCAMNALGLGNQAVASIPVAGTRSLRNSANCKKGENWDLGGKRETPMGSISLGKEQGLYENHFASLSEPHWKILGSTLHPQNQLPKSSFSANSKLARSSREFCSLSLGVDPNSGQGVKMDCNSNEIPIVDHSEDHQPKKGPRALTCDSNGEFTMQNPVTQKGSLALQSDPDECFVQSVNEEQLKFRANHPTVSWRTRKPRKQSHPTRSGDLCDPNFKGVTFRMQTVLSDNRDQCRLLITSNYSAELLKSIKKVRSRTRSSSSSLKTSSSEEDSDSFSLSKDKMCASCDAKKTPLWRDAEDGTPLCNACGIRYKKYRVRCFQCWHIPRKEGNADSKCCKCGDALRPIASQHKLTGL